MKTSGYAAERVAETGEQNGSQSGGGRSGRRQVGWRKDVQGSVPAESAAAGNGSWRGGMSGGPGEEAQGERRDGAVGGGGVFAVNSE